jgi:hypothetical protein
MCHREHLVFISVVVYIWRLIQTPIASAVTPIAYRKDQDHVRTWMTWQLMLAVRVDFPASLAETCYGMTGIWLEFDTSPVSCMPVDSSDALLSLAVT